MPLINILTFIFWAQSVLSWEGILFWVDRGPRLAKILEQGSEDKVILPGGSWPGDDPEFICLRVSACESLSVCPQREFKRVYCLKLMVGRHLCNELTLKSSVSSERLKA